MNMLAMMLPASLSSEEVDCLHRHLVESYTRRRAGWPMILEHGMEVEFLEGMMAKPTVGRMVHYRMSGDMADHYSNDADRALVRPHWNHPVAGRVYAMVITSVPEDEQVEWVNGTVFLNNGDTMPVMFAKESDGSQGGTWFWPPMV